MCEKYKRKSEQKILHFCVSSMFYVHTLPAFSINLNFFVLVFIFNFALFKTKSFFSVHLSQKKQQKQQKQQILFVYVFCKQKHFRRYIQSLTTTTTTTNTLTQRS